MSAEQDPTSIFAKDHAVNLTPHRLGGLIAATVVAGGLVALSPRVAVATTRYPPRLPAAEPKVIVVHDPAPEAPPTTEAPTTRAAPAAPPVDIDINVNGPDVITPAAPVYVPAPPAPVVVSDDPWLIPPGTIEDGVHVGYLTAYGPNWISFDRADVDANGTWTNVNPKVRTMPWNHDIVRMWSGMPIEIHVQNRPSSTSGHSELAAR